MGAARHDRLKRLVLGAVFACSLAVTPTSAQLFGGPQQPVVTEQSEDAALALRIAQLEEQVRTLTGQVEGLTFQLTQFQTIIERLEANVDFRFQALEGGAPGAAAAPDDSAAPDTFIPEGGVRPLPGEQEFDPTFDDGTAPQAAEQPANDQAGASLGALPIENEVLGGPLDLSFDPAATTGNPDADAQFVAAAEAAQRGEVEFAEDQLRQFMELYPDDPRSIDAANWLGSMLLGRGANEEAAEVMLDAFQADENSARAPELLLGVGVALSRVGERDTACRTLNEVATRYTNLTETFRRRLGAEIINAECPPA